MTSRRKGHHQDRHIRIRSVRRDSPDLKKLAAAVIALAMAKAEAEAQAQHDAEDHQDDERDAAGTPPEKGAA